MNDYEITDPYELTHHGVLGQKWGVRRYQNKDGSLTDAGRKRQSIGGAIKDYHAKAKRKKALQKARETRAANKEAAEKRQKLIDSGKLSYKKMTTKEINDRIERMSLEKKYQQLLEETNPSTKMQKVGKDFVKRMWDQAIQPAIADAGKQLLKDQLIKAGTKKSKEELNSEALAKMAKDWQNKANIARDKKNAWKNDYDLREMQKKAKDDADKTANDKNKKRSAEEYEKTGSDYSKKGQQVDNNKEWTKYPDMSKDNTPTNSRKLIGDGIERIVPTADDIVGEGTSKYTERGYKYYDNNPNIKNERTYTKDFYERSASGKRYIENIKQETLALPYESSASKTKKNTKTKSS